MKKQELQSQIQNLVKILLTLGIFLVPVFFLPITTEFFEFNKLTLILVVTVLTLILWGVNVVLSKSISVSRTPVDSSIFIFLAAVALSSIFSINKVDSIYGGQGRWFPSLVGVSTLVVSYYVVASTVRKNSTIKSMLMALIFGSTIATAVSILSYYRVYLGDEIYLQLSTFTPTGAGVITAILGVTSTLIAFVLFMKENNSIIKVLLALSMTITLAFLAISNFIFAWVLLGIGIVIALLFTPVEQRKTQRLSLLALSAASATIVILFFFPATREILARDVYPKEVKLSIKESWIVASSTLRDFPLLGTGPSTFYLNYPRYKSLAANTEDTWNIRFDKPANEVFNVIANLGILGIIATTFLIAKIVRFTVKNRQLDEYSLAIMLGIFATLASFLVTYSTVITGFMLFLFLALGAANYNFKLRENLGESVYFHVTAETQINTIGNLDTSNKTIITLVITAPLLALAITGSFYLYKIYPSEYFMRKAVLSARDNRATETYRYQTRAMQLNPGRDTYRNMNAQTSLVLVRSIAAKGDLTEEEANTVRALISQALTNSRVATEVLNPLNPSGWETRAAVYKILIGSTEDAGQLATQALQRAIQLDPNNPRLRIDLGGIYYAQQDYLTAANFFRQATNLKPDYANAYYNFAGALYNLEDYANAQKALEITQRLVAEGSSDYQVVTSDLEMLNDLPSVAGAQSAKPSVDEIEGSTVDENVTQQEPLVNEGEKTIQETEETEIIEEVTSQE